MKKSIVLCADDYGQAPLISEAILRLIQQKRLSATSCLVNFPHWSEQGSALVPYQGIIDIGLHLNLTQGSALSSLFIERYGPSLFPLSTLIKKAFLKQLDQEVIAAECAAQLEKFIAVMGFKPNFIDGHQHVHQFPQIREAVIDLLETRLRPTAAYIRLPTLSLSGWNVMNNIKKIILMATGTRALKALLLEKGIPFNTSFAGVYAFKQAARYPTLFPTFLREVDRGGLIMCHPGLDDFSNADPIASARGEEYRYLASEQFLKDCEAAAVVIQRFH